MNIFSSWTIVHKNNLAVMFARLSPCRIYTQGSITNSYSLAEVIDACTAQAVIVPDDMILEMLQSEGDSEVAENVLPAFQNYVNNASQPPSNTTIQKVLEIIQPND